MPINLDSHDLQLSDWGPYSKRYAGISHIPDVDKGLRFDLAIMPGHYRRQMLVPNEKWASGHHAWEAASDLSYYAFRYEIEWKDQVYCDVSFSAVSERERLVRCAFVNNTELAQDLMLHLVAYMNFPPVKPYSDEAILLLNVSLPNHGIWIDALDYDDLKFATSRPTDNLVEDGMYRAEIRDHYLVNGNGIGCGFGEESGDSVNYIFQLNFPMVNASISLRYRLENEDSVFIALSEIINVEIELSGDKPDEYGFSLLHIPLGNLEKGEQQLQINSRGGQSIIFDGFAITEKNTSDKINFKQHQWIATPKISQGPNSNSLILKYPDVDEVYGLAWDHSNAWLRELINNELDSFLRLIVPDNYSAVKKGPGDGNFTDVFLRPISMKPNTEEVLYSFVCSGNEDEVEQSLNKFANANSVDLESIYNNARHKIKSPDCLPAGEIYQFSQDRMTAVELLNVVYPVYTRRQFIRHNTPGKWWDCLYTWDSGFIGLALLEIDKQRAIDCLNAYLTPEGDTHAAFIHHGSPVPTQMYLFHELWNRTQDRELLETFYPSLRQYYLFLSGSLGSSTTRSLNSNLLRTWEYFFESGGWDDYPAQLHIHDSNIAPSVTCSAITAHVIRSAKILLVAAEALGIKEDYEIYNKDISTFSNALQEFSWDEDAGYYSYVTHDENDNPIGPLRYDSGENFNMGLDGVMPLFAGICNPEQESLLLNRLDDPKRFWTKIGLSTIDLSAPYYRDDGYWNGAVWMPQQWFMWKTALDLGQGQFAHKIAMTALELWKSEVENSYYCFEHFIIESGRGAGWHQFSGLSSPVISWFEAYYRPGRLTTGMNIWIEEQNFTGDNHSFVGRLKLSGKHRTVSVVINLRAELSYSAKWNGSTIGLIKYSPGSYQIDIPFDSDVGILEVFPS